jgi:pyruvate dehydrogenase kinase 2/3/4
METANGAYSQKPKGGLNQHQDMMNQSACFLHRELPMRLAHRACELEGTDLFKRSDAIVHVSNLYKISFHELTQCEATNDIEREAKFAEIIESIYGRHAATLMTMAIGANEIRTLLHQDLSSFAEHHTLLTRLNEFYMSRIGIRMLIGQYLALPKPSKDPNMLGLISTCASPCDIALQAIDSATFMCRRTYGDAPEEIIHGRKDLRFPYASSRTRLFSRLSFICILLSTVFSSLLFFRLTRLMEIGVCVLSLI